MNIERKDLEKSVVQLTIEVETKSVSKFRKKALAHLKENAEIKGFRKGHVSEDVIVKHYGEEYIAQMTSDFSIDSIYREALQKEKIMPVAQGEIKEIVSQDPLKLIMEVEIFPTITIDEKYKKISLTKKEVVVADTEVQQALTDIETKFTSFVEATDETAKVEMGDRVTISTQGFDSEGAKLENTDMTDYPFVLGSGMLVP